MALDVEGVVDSGMNGQNRCAGPGDLKRCIAHAAEPADANSPPNSRSRTERPKSSRPSHRDASARLAEGADGEVLEQTTARTSRPSPHRFIGDNRPALSEQIADVAKAER